MKLALYPFKPIPINNGEITVIETNNTVILQQLLQNCYDLSDDFHFSNDSFELVSTHKAFWWLGDVYLNQNLDKLFQHQLYKRMASMVGTENLQEILESIQKLSTLILEKTYLLDLPLTVSPNVELESVLKMCNLRFDNGLLKSPYAIMEAILKTAVELEEQRVLGFQNVTDYLTKNEFVDLVTLVQALKLPVIIIKYSEIQRSEYFRECRYIYIDQDFIDWRFS